MRLVLASLLAFAITAAIGQPFPSKKLSTAFGQQVLVENQEFSVLGEVMRASGVKAQ